MRKIPDLPKRYKLLIKLSALLGRALIRRALIFYMSGIDIRSKQILCLTGGRICVKIIYGKKVKIMVFSQKVKIALNAVKLLSGLKEGEVYDAKVCAERLGVSVRYLEQVLYLLRKSGFISARRGADGGYYLSDKGKASNAGEIIAAVSGSEESGEDFSSIVSAAMDNAAERIDFTPRMQGIYLDNAATTSADREVVEKMRQMTVERSDGIVPLSCRMTVGEWMEVWEKDFLGDVKESTAYLYKRSVELYIVKYLGAIKLDGLTALMIQRFYNRLIEPESESVRALSAKSVRNIHGILHKALQQAVQIGYLPKNPADGCKPPRAEKKEIQPLNENQIQLFLAEIQGHPHEYLYKIALFTGIREGEILGLTWDCVDFERGTLRIRQQLRRQQKKGGTYYLSSPKNGKCRMITLPPSVLHLFQLQKGKQNEMRFRARELWTENNLVFTNQIGGYLSYRTVYAHSPGGVGYNRLCTAVGVCYFQLCNKFG